MFSYFYIILLIKYYFYLKPIKILTLIMILIFISVGSFQDYMIYNIKNCLLLGYNNILVLTETINFEKLKDVFDKINIKSIDNINTIFDNKSKLNRDFRNGFFHNCSKRFFILYEYLKHNKINEPILHIENDVLLYKKLEYINFNNQKINLIMDNENRCIPGLIFIPNIYLLEKIIDNYQYDKDDMKNLALFYNNNKNLCISLPIINNNTKYNTNTIYNELYYQYKSIFDGAAIGQYIGGVDPRNIKGNTIGFINETCNIKYNNFKFQLTKYGDNYLPNIIIDNKLIPINNLHIHSKNLINFTINNFKENNFIKKEIDIITGEKIQFNCNHFIGFPMDFNTNPNILIKHKNKCIDIEKCIMENKEINNGHIIFCYTHILDNINALIKILKLMKNKFILIFHNSDYSFNESHLILYNELELLDHIYTQNCNIKNNKVTPIPIGIANSQWKHGNLNVLLNVYKQTIKKSNNIYFNFNIKTNMLKRKLCYDIITNKGIKWNNNKQYMEYLQELKSYKYAICPEGNGIDTHRFWECLYMNVIPICVKNVIVEYYSNYFPIIILNNWNELNIESLILNYKNENKINHYHLDMKSLLNHY